MSVIQFDMNKGDTCLHTNDTTGVYSGAIANIFAIRHHGEKLIAAVAIHADMDAHNAALVDVSAAMPLCKKRFEVDQSDPTFAAAYSAASNAAETKLAVLNYLLTLPTFSGGVIV